MLETLFPADVVLVSADSADLWAADLDPREAGDIAHAASARQREFAVGRACARLGLRRLGLPDAPLPRTPERAPAWPESATGSITHCEEFCAAVVGLRAAVRGLGIDAERTGRVTDPILERITSEAERDALAGLASGPTAPVWPTLVWTAKEASLKCLAAVSGRLPGPRQIAIEFSAEPGAFRVSARSPEPLTEGLPELRGRYAWEGTLVVAGVACPQPGAKPVASALP